jgi:cystathionine beta-lyase family protein involved in aluminum resistance
VSSNIGGLINGNYGVGKTETIKTLARCLAKPFISWSCRGGCTYNGLSRIFSGMIIGGWWLSLDEIN